MNVRIPDIRGGSLHATETHEGFLKVRLVEPIEFGGERNAAVLTPENAEKLGEELIKWSKKQR